MKTPITREEFIRIGRRYSTNDLIHEADRLIPLATDDIEVLGERGYGQAMLEELKELRVRLSSELADKKEARGNKAGACMSERDAKKAARLVLRSGIALARVALARRQAPDGESAEETCEVVSNLTGQIDTLSKKTARDSASLRSSIEALRTLLERPDLAAQDDDAEARARFVSKLDEVHSALVEISTSKKASKDMSRSKTISTDEADGRAYANLRLLTQVGRAAFRELNDPARADFYVLTSLHRKQPPPSSSLQPVPSPP